MNCCRRTKTQDPDTEVLLSHLIGHQHYVGAVCRDPCFETRNISKAKGLINNKRNCHFADLPPLKSIRKMYFISKVQFKYMTKLYAAY